MVEEIKDRKTRRNEMSTVSITRTHCFKRGHNCPFKVFGSGTQNIFEGAVVGNAKKR